MQPSVSIITTIYNSAMFLEEAIVSVTTQSHLDWELILVDDGSNDGSVEIANSWCARDVRITLLTHPGHENRGISASRNLGIRAAKGDLIAFLDSDDVWLPGKLARQIVILESNPEAAMTFGAAERWYSWDGTNQGTRDFVRPSAIPGWGADRILPPPELLKAFLQDESLTPCTCSILVRRHAVLQAGAFEESFRGLYDDQVFYAKLCLAEPVYVSSECVARYRQHETSCCAIARSLGSEEQERTHFLRWLDEYQSALVCAPSR